MTLLEIQVDLKAVAVELRRIAEVLERAFPAPAHRPIGPLPKGQVSRIDYAEAYRALQKELDKKGEVEYEQWPYRPRQ